MELNISIQKLDDGRLSVYISEECSSGYEVKVDTYEQAGDEIKRYILDKEIDK